MAGASQDDWRLHWLCQKGRLEGVQQYVRSLDRATLRTKLSVRKGSFHNTPLHEAVSNGHSSVLDYLLECGGDVNSRTKSGYTLLHLAASNGDVECARVLLSHNADISATDESGMTAKQIAELGKKFNIVRLLRSEEIVRNVENDVLVEKPRENVELETDCLSRALLAAVKRDNHLNVANLVTMGAENLDEANQLAKREGRHCARAMLLMLTAAINGDCSLVRRVFGEPALNHAEAGPPEEDLEAVQDALKKGKVSTILPIEVAHRKGHKNVRVELLLRTNVNQQHGKVHWYGLCLEELEVLWLREIQWVKQLCLAFNKLKVLPEDINLCLQHVEKLDLQSNELTAIPGCILELPNLVELNLSNNRLTSLPDLAQWSSQLTILNLSHNKLTTIPGCPHAPSIHTLILAGNSFTVVPHCICSFVTIRSLDLSDNKSISTLPLEMGKLKELTSLSLKGLKNLRDPPKHFHQRTAECIGYLREKLLNSKGYYCMKLVVLGKQNSGKTALVAQLREKEYENRPTLGMSTCEWECSVGLGKKFCFRIWDFSGQDECYAAHQFFLSERSIYLIVFDMTLGGCAADEITPWLNSIVSQAPLSIVMIVGTHLDKIPNHKREESCLSVTQEIASLVDKFHNMLVIRQAFTVSLKDRCIEGVGALKEAIYHCAEDYKHRGVQVMGEKVPLSYHVLDKHIRNLLGDVRNGTYEPIMSGKEYRCIVQQLKLTDLQDEGELSAATKFLHNAGTLLHYGDHIASLGELYFIDPEWLCSVMTKIIAKNGNELCANGVLNAAKIIPVLDNVQFPWHFLKEFLVLLDGFEVALLLQKYHLLIPSMLPKEKPPGAYTLMADQESLYVRHVFFKALPSTSARFWSRLLSFVVRFIPQVWHVLETTNVNLETSVGTIDLVKISDSVSFLSLPSEVEHLPLLKENFPAVAAHPSALPTTFDSCKGQFVCWRTGMSYRDPTVAFGVESLSSSIGRPCTREGAMVVASLSALGTKIASQIQDLIALLVEHWYPGMQQEQNCLGEAVLCSECMKSKCPEPYHFGVEKCCTLIGQNMATIECGYNENERAKNHTIALSKVVPDLLLQDLDPLYLLDHSELFYKEENPVQGTGNFVAIHNGKYRGNIVAVKRYYWDNLGKCLKQIRKDVMLLQRSSHPCVVAFIGACVQPPALVLEELPMGPLERWLFEVAEPIHRVVIHRIAAQVAAALSHLHSSGIVHGNVQAASVLLWSLDPMCLCHCKLADLGCTTYITPAGVQGLKGTRGFLAPEVLRVGGRRKEHSCYDHKADIFSFGMLLYQMITRSQPYHDKKLDAIDYAIEKGERPRLDGSPQAENTYFCLTQLMRHCWQGEPQLRPTPKEIITSVSLPSFQMMMTAKPVQSKLSLRNACMSPPLRTTDTCSGGDLWVCCDSAEGTEIITYASDAMVVLATAFLKSKHVQCVEVFGDYLWVATRTGVEQGEIHIFSVPTRDLVHIVYLRDNLVSCMTCSDRLVFCGTLDGYCLSFDRDVHQLQFGKNPHMQYLSESAVDGIVVLENELWVSHSNNISFLKLENLVVDGSVSPSQTMCIGQLKVSADKAMVWSAQVGRLSVSAWDAKRRQHLYDVDIRKQMEKISPYKEDSDVVVTAMVPVLDVVWVGLSDGHIIILKEQLLAWFHPYEDRVRFLKCVPFGSPDNSEAAMVVSGAKGLKSPSIPGLPNYVNREEKDSGTGSIIIWEAFPSKMCKQISLIQSLPSNYLDSRSAIKDVISSGEFSDDLCQDVRDGVHVKAGDEVGTAAEEEQVTQGHPSVAKADVVERHLASAESLIYASTGNLNMPAPSEGTERLEIKTSRDGSSSVCVDCPKPAQLRVLLSQLEVSAGFAKDSRVIVYRPHNAKVLVKLCDQEDFDAYLQLSARPDLLAYPAY